MMMMTIITTESIKKTNTVGSDRRPETVCRSFVSK